MIDDVAVKTSLLHALDVIVAWLQQFACAHLLPLLAPAAPASSVVPADPSIFLLL